MMRRCRRVLVFVVCVTALASSAAVHADEPTISEERSLGEFLVLVDEGNLDLVVLRERVAQAEAGLKKAWSSLLPQASIAGVYTRNSDAAELPLPDPRAGYLSQPLPSPPAQPGSVALIPNKVEILELQPLDQWMGVGKVTAPVLVMPAYLGIASASDGVELASRVFEHGRDELKFGLAQAYYGAAAARQMISLADEQLRTAQGQERLAQARFEAGQVPKIAWLRAGVDRAKAEQDLLRARNGYRAAKVAIATITGFAGDFDVKVPEETGLGLELGMTSAEQELLRTALDLRKDLAASNGAVQIADRTTRMELWKLAPVLSASAEYRLSNAAGFTGDNSTWLVQLTAAMSIYDGGRYADVDNARARARENLAQRDNLVRKIGQEVKTSLLELESARANLAKAKEQEKLAKENAQIVEAQLDAGVATYLDAVDARTVRFAAGVAVLNEELGVKVSRLKLAKAIGQLGKELPAAQIATKTKP